MLLSPIADLLIAIAALSPTTSASRLSNSTTTTPDADFDWDDVSANASFQWQSCYGEYQCALLQVPMDWHGNSTEANKTVKLAVIKLEATVPITDPTYGGAVVYNPGGPGGSGVAWLSSAGQPARTILSAGPDAQNDSQPKFFDIISFDPRGVMNSRPAINCFANSIEYHDWNQEKAGQGIIEASPTSFDNIWHRIRGASESCSNRYAEQGIAMHVSTAPVARDVVEIFERHGQWREEKAKQLVATQHQNLSSEEQSAILNRTAYQKGNEKIQYWGTSYGTVLGATIAAMYPERIHRLVLDGVADAHDYMAGTWLKNLQDSDKEFAMLAEYCASGGPENCPIWSEDGAAAILSNMTELWDNLRENPIPSPGDGNHSSVLVTWSDLTGTMSSALNSAFILAPQLAKIFAELRNGSVATLAAGKLSSKNITLSDKCVEHGPFSSACRGNQEQYPDAGSAIRCTDGVFFANATRDEYKQYADALIAQSLVYGRVWPEGLMPCTAWNVTAHWRYDGDFVANTAHPLLIIGTTYDPVTPLANAFTMASGFNGSVVLEQNSCGHGLNSGPSMCTAKALRAYFQTGELPVINATHGAAYCEPDLLPFHGYPGEEGKPPLPANETDEALWDAVLGGVGITDSNPEGPSGAQ